MQILFNKMLGNVSTSLKFQVQNAIQSTRNDDKDIEGEFYKISDVKENEPIFADLQRSGIGFRSMNPKEHTLWPVGRGLYINCNRTQSILINEQEHLRFISKELNGDFGKFALKRTLYFCLLGQKQLCILCYNLNNKHIVFQVWFTKS